MKQILLNFFAKNGGTIARAIAALIAGGISQLVTRYGFELTPDQSNKIAVGVAAGVAGFIGEAVTYYQAQGIKTIQAAIQPLLPEVRTDGTAGAVTISAVQTVAAAAAKPEAMPVSTDLSSPAK